MRCNVRTLLVAIMALAALAALASCRTRRARPSVDDASTTKTSVHDASPTPGPTVLDAPITDEVAAALLRAELAAAERDLEAECARPVTIYAGSIRVSGNSYVHRVERGEDFVDAPIDGLDRVVTKATKIRFTLDYPFERPFAGVITGKVTLRRTIDAIRAGFRTMYEGASVRDIPGKLNKDVTGPYGRAFHAKDDLVIEAIELCADDTLSISIGS